MADKYILAIDQGTTSSRAIVFNHEGRIVSVGQKEHEQIFPRASWVEHNAIEVWDAVREVVGEALAKAGLNKDSIQAVGVTNQRETTLVWNKETGQPVYNAIVWQDTRTAKIIEDLGGGDQDKYKARVGLPLATYFSDQVKWVLDNVEGARADMSRQADHGQHGHLGDLEPDRRRQRRRARDRCHQRLPHHADGPEHAVLGCGDRG